MAWTFAAVLTGVLAASTIVLAQPAPSTQPSPAEAEAPRQVYPGGPGSPGGGFGGPRRNFRGGGRWGMEIPPQEWNQVAEFMERHSPRRWRAFQSLPEERNQGVRRMMYVRYRNLEELRDADPELYDLRMRQLVMEDDVWRLVDELRAARTESERGPIIEQIRQRVQETTSLWLKERDRRLERQEAALKIMKDDLTADQQNVENIVNERVQREIDRARLPEGAIPEGEPHPDGGHPGERGPGGPPGERPPRHGGPPPAP